jgi:lambda family phage portal protein
MPPPTLEPATPRSAPPALVNRMYGAAKASRLTADWHAATTSADAEIRSSLTALRARCRALGRDSAYAKRAKLIVVNNVVGQGIGLQAQVKSTRGGFLTHVNRAIEDAWRLHSQARFFHTGGELDEADFERAVMSEVFEAGEVFIREHFDYFGGGAIPYALELIESERVPHTVQPQVAPGAELRMGIEVDRFYRPLWYWVRARHPSEWNFNSRQSAEELERVPAAEMIHMRLIERWPQTRAVPLLHAVAKKVNDMDGYSEAEIVAARGAANYMASVETDPLATLGEETEDGYREIEVAPGAVFRLATGEKLNFHAPNRPNTALDPFMRYMLREMAAGCGVSYESLSRDYSQSNYSSSRLALIDDRDSWRVLQGWFIRKFRQRVHRAWLNQAMLARAVPGVALDAYAADPEKYVAAKFKPRGWSWVDPTKEVAAYKEAERAGYTTKSRIIAQTGDGMDFEDVMEERRAELDAAAELNLAFDTDPGAEPAEPAAPPAPDPDDGAAGEDDDEGKESNDAEVTTPARYMRVAK